MDAGDLPTAASGMGSAAPIFLTSPAEFSCHMTGNHGVGDGGGGGFTTFTTPTSTLPLSLTPLLHPAFSLDDIGNSTDNSRAEATGVAAASAATNAASTVGDSYYDFSPGA